MSGQAAQPTKLYWQYGRGVQAAKLTTRLFIMFRSRRCVSQQIPSQAHISIAQCGALAPPDPSSVNYSFRLIIILSR
jgi:hypothetical protein